MKTPLAVHHLAVVVADLARAERFYGGVLGLPVLRRHDDEHGAPRAVWLSLGDADRRNGSSCDDPFLALELAHAAGPTREDDAPGWHCVALGITVDDREKWRRRLEEAGHPILRETSFTLYVRDPDGNLVGLSHHPAPQRA